MCGEAFIIKCVGRWHCNVSCPRIYIYIYIYNFTMNCQKKKKSNDESYG